MRNYFCVCIFLWGFVNLFQKIVIPLEGLLLESVILVNLIWFQLQQPTHCLLFNVKLLILHRLKRVHSIRKNLVIVNVLKMLTEKKLCCLRILLWVDVVELHTQFIILKDLLFHSMLLVLYVFWVGLDKVRWDIVLGDKIVFFHHHRQKLFLGLVILIPHLIVNFVLWGLLQGVLLRNMAAIDPYLPFVVFDERISCLETFYVGIGKLGHNISLHFELVIILCSL